MTELTPFQVGYLMGLEAANFQLAIMPPDEFRHGEKLSQFNQGVEMAYAVHKAAMEIVS